MFMSSASVDGAIIQKLLKENRESISRLERAKQSLVNKYSSLKSVWSDSKHHELGVIINECSMAIEKARTIINECYQKLEQINIHVQEYESVNLDGAGVGNNSNQISRFSQNSFASSDNYGTTTPIYGSGLPLASSIEKPHTLSRSKDELIEVGLRAIDSNMNERAQHWRDKRLTENDVQAIVSYEREKAQIELYDDVYGKVDEECISCLQRYSNYFSEENWDKMSGYERADALNTLAINAGEAFRTEVLGVKYYKGSPCSRGYYNGDGYLYLNEDVLTNSRNRLDAIDTVFHEGRHAFQERAAVDNVSCSIDRETAEEWGNNFPPNYIRPGGINPMRYFQQPIEADAYNFAERIIRNGGV